VALDCGPMLPMPRNARLLAASLVALLLLSAALFVSRSYWHGSLTALFGPSEKRLQELLPGANAPPAPRVASELEALDGRMLEGAARYAAEHGSLALIVSRHDHIVFERYWQGSGFDTVVDSQSFTPLLAALAAGVAVSHRRIGWPDEPIGAFLPEWSHEPRGAVTVRNLMQMSSGLAPAAHGAASADIVAAALSEPLIGTPGLTYLEQAADPQLLALVIERATAQRYASYLSQALWRRVGAADAWLQLDRSGGTPHADCCLRARQGDWIRIGQLLVKDGNYRGEEVIRPGWVTLMRTPAKSNPAYGAYVRLAGKGLPNLEAYEVSDLFVAGSEGGHRLCVVPSLQLAILCTAAPSGRGAGWIDARIPNLIVRSARDYVPAVVRPGADLSGVVPGH